LIPQISERKFKEEIKMKITTHNKTELKKSILQWRLVQEGQMGNAPPKQIVK
jgi:hypothetical protein